MATADASHAGIEDFYHPQTARTSMRQTQTTSTHFWKPLLTSALVLLSGCHMPSAANAHGPHRVVTDLSGRSVSIPAQINRIACLTGACYEKAFLVGAGNKVIARATAGAPWMARTNPRSPQIPMILNSHQPNVEELLNLKPDVVFFWDNPAVLDTLGKNGLTALVPQPEKNTPTSIAAFTERMKNEVRFYGQVVDGDAQKRAEDWCSYYDQRVQYVLQRTQNIPEEKKTKVYYLRGPSPLTTHGAEANITWYGEMAGAHMVVKDSGLKNISQVSMEDMFHWNPDVIFVGRQYSPDLVLNDARWKNIAAVRNKRVYVIPDGVFYWDSGSEGVLLLEFMAQKLYPDLFRDLDMKHEVMTYYARFYRYALPEDEAGKMLHGAGPDGTRSNPLNN